MAAERLRAAPRPQAKPTPARRPPVLRTTALAISLASALSSCSAPGRIEPPGPPPPPAWQAQSEDAVLPSPQPGPAGAGVHGVQTDWWRGFGDPALDRVIETALEENLGFEQAAAGLQAAAADARIALGALYPGVAVGLTRAQQRQNFIGLPIPGLPADEVLTADFTQYGLSLDLSWELNVWREAAPAARAAAAGFQAAVADVAGARVSLAGQTARLYFLAVEAAGQARIAAGIVASHEESLHATRARARVGDGSPADIRAAEAALADARSRLVLAEDGRSAAIRGLEVLLGQYPDGRPGPDWALADALPDGGLDVPPGAPADLVSRRPDVAGAERRLAASREGTLIARRARYPGFALTGSAGTATSGLRQLLDGDFSVWSLLARIAAPVFQGGRIRARVARSEAEDRAALAAFAGTLLSAYQEVEAGLSAERALARSEALAEEAARASRDAAELSAGRRRAGFAPLLAVLAAERAALGAESALLASRRALLDNRINLLLALGGGFEVEADVSADAGGNAARAMEDDDARPGREEP